MRRAPIFAMAAVAIALGAGAARGAPLDEVPDTPFARLRGELAGRAATPWSPQHCAATETALDRESFADLNRVRGVKLLDRADGWSIEARVGGRPFHCFTELRVGEQLVAPSASDFDPAGTPIAFDEVEDHFGAGKSVNRLWLLHRSASGEFPVTVVFTADGFLVVGGAAPPVLLGTTLRTGIIGEPFGDGDYAQHVESVSVRELDADTLELTYLVESEAAVAAVESTIRWDAARDAPILEFRTALSSRVAGRLGFVGGNALRGPTLHGLLDACGDPPPLGGIAAFHDVRSALIALPDGRVVRDLLVPPLGAHTVERQRLLDGVPEGTRLILEQTQHVAPGAYFSHHPGVPYRERADLVITLGGPPAAAVSVERAQVAADLASSNPEANETVNVYLATEVEPGRVVDLGYSVEVAADDFDNAYDRLESGLVFVQSQAAGPRRLAFLALDPAREPAGEPVALTGPVVVDPRRPAASADGRWVAFDARHPTREARRGIFVLDRRGGDVRRATVDPGSAVSFDRGAALDADGTRFAFVTNRGGERTAAAHARVDAGVGCGFGELLGCADHVALDASGTRLARTCDGSVLVQELDSSVLTVVSAHLGARDPTFSPEGGRLAFASDTGLWIADLRGGSERRVADSGESPAWAGPDALVFHRVEDGEADLHVVAVAGGAPRRLTPRDGIDAREPTFVSGAR